MLFVVKDVARAAIDYPDANSRCHVFEHGKNRVPLWEHEVAIEDLGTTSGCWQEIPLPQIVKFIFNCWNAVAVTISQSLMDVLQRELNLVGYFFLDFGVTDNMNEHRIEQYALFSQSSNDGC